MKKTKFKLKDKVKIRLQYNHGGKMGTVIDIDDDGEGYIYCYKVQFKHGGTNAYDWFAAYQLQLISPKKRKKKAILKFENGSEIELTASEEERLIGNNQVKSYTKQELKEELWKFKDRLMQENYYHRKMNDGIRVEDTIEGFIQWLE